MDQTLGYLREILSNYTDEHHTGARQLYHKLMKGHYQSEESFVRDLTGSEIDFLNKILPDEINYAKQEQDEKRLRELNEVYELLI
ncbi:sigma-G-dependent sporulation-specific acid-soluble spore protein CsgA [Neobacillus muris]|uniref:sigma-G-dependent sporulation-specific acid-soluble spore protein CsgA n=1 Tax=Neobacillus muris TaxID=2941334 RepID=UPI00203CE6E5|nr:sigma-G-dependent sporulation-specific acid-soluble spore protein CsgA [Neobacillus muris]